MINKFPSDEVIEILKSLNYGDDLIVYWRDACGFRDVKFPEEIHYTPKVTRGAFYKLVNDHLIVVSEETDRGSLFEGSVIPVGIIEKIEIIRKRRKKPKKRYKSPENTHHPIKIVTITEKVPSKT